MTKIPDLLHFSAYEIPILEVKSVSRFWTSLVLEKSGFGPFGFLTPNVYKIEMLSSHLKLQG